MNLNKVPTPPTRPQGGLFEVFHWIETGRKWTYPELKEASFAAQSRGLSGWPLGVVLENHPDAKPMVKEDYIEASVSVIEGCFDYWRLYQDGTLYLARTLEEDFRWKNIETQKYFYWDTQTERIAEAFVHCKKLYQALKVEEAEQINFQINYMGLEGRVLSGSQSGTSLFLASFRPRQAASDKRSWQGTCSIDLITSNLVELVYQATQSIFATFDFFEPTRESVANILKPFRQ